MFIEFWCELFITRDRNGRGGDKGVQIGRKIQSFRCRTCREKSSKFYFILVFSLILFLLFFHMIKHKNGKRSMSSCYNQSAVNNTLVLFLLFIHVLKSYWVY